MRCDKNLRWPVGCPEIKRKKEGDLTVNTVKWQLTIDDQRSVFGGWLAVGNGSSVDCNGRCSPLEAAEQTHRVGEAVHGHCVGVDEGLVGYGV